MKKKSKKNRHRFKIITKIWFSIGILVFGYFISTLIVFALGSHTEKRIERVSNFLFPATTHSSRAKSAFKEQMDLYEDAVMSGEDIFVESARKNSEKSLDALKNIISLKHLNDDKKKEVQDLYNQLKEFTKSGNSVYKSMSEAFRDDMDIKDESMPPDELSLFMSDKAIKLAHEADSIRDSLTELNEYFNNALKKEFSSIIDITHNQRYLNLILCVVVIFISLTLITIIVNRAIVRPLKRSFMLQMAVEQSIDGIAVFNLLGKIEYVNNAWAKMHGFDPAFLQNKTISYFHTQQQMTSEIIPLVRRIETEGFHMCEVGHKRKNDTTFPTMMAVNLLKDENNNPTHLVGLARDISIQKQNEEELRMARDAAEASSQALQESLETLKKTQNQLIQSEKMASLGGLVAGVAHEINTPLGISVTASSFLERKTREIKAKFDENCLKRSDFKKYIEIGLESATSILSNLNRAAELIQSFKQVAVDQTVEEKRVFALKHYIDEVFISLRPRYKRTDHKITVDCPEDLELNSYPGVFMQVITNLVMNSLIHGFEDIEEGHISIEIVPREDKVMIIYSDDGKGMNDQQLSKIFDPFYTTKRGQGGTGLGMHIVFNLVTQSLSGEIECDSSPGEGTVFSISIPRNLDQ
ncbi:membrane protein containing ATP-binding region, ATPase-like domain protein [Candidatus Magnetomorum sp. HK-1]|nr:membrane protein containing ATP-binding region, ATPase-like domain protein [Candidatus Magnetomorum sp. HK-1]